MGKIRADGKLRSLSQSEWEALLPIGHMRVKSISFGRGTARLNVQSQRDLQTLARNLEAWPHYYVVVEGHARAEGDPAANLELAGRRAEAATEYLVSIGVNKDRIKAKAIKPSGRQGESQSVSFSLGQPPY